MQPQDPSYQSYQKILKQFVKKLKDLSPGDRDTLITDATTLLKEFAFTPEDVTLHIDDRPEGLVATLQSYFFLYLWELRIIDQAFINAVSQVSASDPAGYETVKNQYLQVIQEIPIEMIDPVLKIYNDKRKALKQRFKEGPDDPAPDAVVLSSQKKSRSPAASISEEDFKQSLITLIENVNRMIDTDLHQKIEASFDAEKASFLETVHEILALPSDNPGLNLLVEEVTKIFRNWAENKESILDESGRSLMTFLTQRSTTPELEESADSETISLPMARSFTLQYNKMKQNLLPTKIREYICGLCENAKKNPSIIDTLPVEAIGTLQYGKYDEHLHVYLTGVLSRLEHANRLVFAVQQLRSAKIVTQKGPSASSSAK